MTKEQNFLISVLADFINKRITTEADQLDWTVLISYAEKHQVAGILYYQCKSFLPEEAAKSLQPVYMSSIYFYMNREKQFKEIGQKLSEEKIPFFSVKGLLVARDYPAPSLRTMGDCDIVVHPEDKNKAHEVMCRLGYKKHSAASWEWIYFKNRLEFELHDHLLYDQVVNSQISRDFTDEAWKYTTHTEQNFEYELDWNFHFVFLMLHLKKHFLNKGVGFRQFMDLTVVIQHHQLDWIWLSEILEKLELLEFTKVCLTLCEKWFMVEMPVKAIITDTFFKEATLKIFNNGVFGFDDPANAENAALNVLEKKGKVKMILGSIFPAYKVVKHVPHYSFVKNRPWLLPLVWIYRPFRSIRYGKGADGVRMLNRAVTSDEALKERKEMLGQWGL